jgi:regulator of protease activity HflC (stomatin/prohibitin superfamily)
MRLRQKLQPEMLLPRVMKTDVPETAPIHFLRGKTMVRSAHADNRDPMAKWGAVLVFCGAVIALGLGLFLLGLSQFVVEVPAYHVGVLIHKTGRDLSNSDVVAPDASYKGVQKELLDVGRYFFKYDPYNWNWEIKPQNVVADGKIGVRIRLYGDDLPYGEFLARHENEKGIVPGVLLPGRYPINPYLYKVEDHAPQMVPAGFKGVVINRAGRIPSHTEDYWDDSDMMHQKLLVNPGFRGVEFETLNPGTYNFNPYEREVKLVDCRNQRFNLSESRDLGFPSKDGFWVSLDSIVEFRVKPEMAAKVFVLYNEEANGDRIDEEIVRKVILPVARAFCRVQGSKNTGRDFIEGTSRTQFQDEYQKMMSSKCGPLGIEIIQALITKINPPEQIAKPVRSREIAKQQEQQYRQEILQQKSEEKLAVEKEMVKQKQELVTAEQQVVRVTTAAMREQEVALTKAREKLAVAEFRSAAAKDEAAAIQAKGEGAAEVVEFKNKAEAAGWERSVKAFSGSGEQFAQFVLYQKMASAYRSIMVNTADSPIMKIFESFNKTDPARVIRPDQMQSAKNANRQEFFPAEQEETAQP